MNMFSFLSLTRRFGLITNSLMPALISTHPHSFVYGLFISVFMLQGHSYLIAKGGFFWGCRVEEDFLYVTALPVLELTL